MYMHTHVHVHAHDKYTGLNNCDIFQTPTLGFNAHVHAHTCTCTGQVYWSEQQCNILRTLSDSYFRILRAET